MSIWQSARVISACAALMIAPLSSQAAMFMSPDRTPKYGPIHFHPNSITLGLGLGEGGAASFRVSQRNYTGRFRGTIQCSPNLFNKPRLHINGHTVTVLVPPQGLVLSIFCYATIEGGGGVTGQEPILIDIGLD